MVVCPNGEGSPFDCTPFCELCEGEGEVEGCRFCGSVEIWVSGYLGCKCQDCGRWDSEE